MTITNSRVTERMCRILLNIQKNDVEKDMGRNRKVDSEMREAKGCSGKLTDRKKRGR